MKPLYFSWHTLICQCEFYTCTESLCSHSHTHIYCTPLTKRNTFARRNTNKTVRCDKFAGIGMFNTIKCGFAKMNNSSVELVWQWNLFGFCSPWVRSPDLAHWRNTLMVWYVNGFICSMLELNGIKKWAFNIQTSYFKATRLFTRRVQMMALDCHVWFFPLFMPNSKRIGFE